MSVAAIPRWRGVASHGAGLRFVRGWLPLYALSRRRRLAVAGAVAAIACALTVTVCIKNDFAGVAAARAALGAARNELELGRRAQRALPALREAAASAARHEPRRGGSSADDARNVSELAAAAGVALVSLAPGASGGHGAETSRALSLTAQGNFTQVRSFLHRLAHAPVLIVPTEVAIERNGPQLVLAATLSVFDGLPPLPAPATDDAGAPRDPFALQPAGAADAADGLRLAGLLQDRVHALALIETPDGTDAVEPGGRIGRERVVRIAMPVVTLAAGGATRALTWTEDGR